MEHELLHNDPGDYDLRLSNNKAKKDKDKTEPGERKKWNFRKASIPEGSGGNDGPSTFGLINQSSETKSKKTVSPTMIFENALSDHDEPNDIQVKTPPNLSQSPKTPNTDQQQGTKITRVRHRSLPMSTSPPSMIQRPQSVRKQGEHLYRQVSVPQHNTSTLLQQQLLTSPTQERPDLTKTTSDLQTSNQWQSVQQPYFTPDSLPNVIEKSQENPPHKARALSDKDTGGAEIVDDNRNTMWQGNQDKSHGNWTEFLSPTNEVFVPDDRAWAGTENVVVDIEDGADMAPGNASHSSRSSNSSESDNDDNTEESVWRISDEQRAYYLNQFRILQPAEKGVVAGQKARDFFLKSELATDVLSKIWNLADLDNDGALNFEEFCIAMHIAVAARHGVEVPATLPPYLAPEKYETQAVAPQVVETSSNELSLQDSSQSWARFSPDPRNEMSETVQAVGTTTGSVQHAQPGPQHQSSQHVLQTSQHTQQLRQQPQAGAAEMTQHNQQPTQPVAQHEQPVTTTSPQQSITKRRSLERTMSDPNSLDENTSKDSSTHTPRKISLGIPRVRGQSKQTNLLDTPHWAILPPPSKFTKDNPEETGKGNQYVPTGTIIPADPEDHSKQVKLEKPDQVDRLRDSESDSSSSETEETVNKERAKSLSHEDSESSLSKNSSSSSLKVSQDSVDGKKMPAPLPPPRRRSGHSRSSSLDLQKLFNKGGNTASLQNVTDYNKESTRTTQENFANFDDFNKFENTNVSHSNENIARFSHKRSASLDSAHALFVEPSTTVENVEAKDSPSVRPDVSASVPRPVPKKKPASPPPPLLNKQKKEIQQVDSGSDSVVEKEKKLSKEPIHFVVKPLTRLEQLHAKIRDLKTKNTRLSRINNELQQELKEMMEKRVGLESSLEQLKPFAK